ncbi:acyl carrier protein [Chelativorans sp.]|uniref:acyl carrier protein n=1 Tax=Chelativorans sp. TaxID=2203393 RepID=UPI002810FB86|nr:acyl carrier protein [Chelativorans sp.]
MQAEQQADSIGKTILEKIRGRAEGDPSGISFSTPLDELGIHSLELTELIFDLEDEFGVEVEMNTAQAWEKLGTVQDLVDAVRALVSAKS